MKNILCSLLIALALVGCQSDELLNLGLGSSACVTFELQTPQSEISTRAYSDGLTATYLTYGVYRVADDGTLTLVDQQVRKNQFADHKATVELQLLKGYDYKVVFWGDAGPQCPYVLDLEAQTVTMDYATSEVIEGNNEARDVFYQIVTLSADDLSANLTEDVYLYRPLSQLNFGSSDLTEEIVRKNAPVAEIDFEVTIPSGHLPTVFNLVDQTASEACPHAVTFCAKGVPAESAGDFPVEGYEYVSMNYVLSGLQDEADEVVTKTVIDDEVTLTARHSGLGDDVVVSVYNLPLERNYRTNIYGALLTDPASFEISIDPRYRDDFFILEHKGVWYRGYCDGTMLADAVCKGFNVALLCDLTVSSTMQVTSDVGVFLNGYTLTTTVNGTTFQQATNTGTLTILEGDIEVTGNNAILAQSVVANSSMVIEDVNISGNSSTYIMTIMLAGPGGASLTMTNSTIDVEGATGMYGVMLTAQNTSATLTNCDITVKSTGSGSTGVMASNYLGSLEMTNCNVTTTAESTGSATYSYGVQVVGNSSTATITDCEISATGGLYTYGLLAYSNTVTVENTNVRAAGSGTGAINALHNNAATVTATDCTFSTSANTTGTTNGMQILQSGTATFTDCALSATNEGSGYAYGIQEQTSSTVKAEGTSITASSESASNVYGVQQQDASTFEAEGTSITAKGTGNICGILQTASSGAKLTLDDCEVYTESTGGGHVHSLRHLVGTEATVSGTKFTSVSKGGSISSTWCVGITCYEDMEITNCEVTCTSEATVCTRMLDGYTDGINPSITINGCTLTGICTDKSNEMEGVINQGRIKINDTRITVQGCVGGTGELNHLTGVFNTGLVEGSGNTISTTNTGGKTWASYTRTSGSTEFSSSALSAHSDAGEASAVRTTSGWAILDNCTLEATTTHSGSIAYAASQDYTTDNDDDKESYLLLKNGCKATATNTAGGTSYDLYHNGTGGGWLAYTSDVEYTTMGSGNSNATSKTATVTITRSDDAVTQMSYATYAESDQSSSTAVCPVTLWSLQ